MLILPPRGGEKQAPQGFPAQAGASTLSPMSDITIAPVDEAAWDDVQAIFSAGGDGPGCQCMWPLMRSVDFSKATRAELERGFRDDIGRSPAPGLVLHIDGEPAGWVRVGPRPRQARLRHTRELPAASAHDIDDGSVWAVTCFSIARPFRGSGIMARLLDAAIVHARQHGARIIEGYPRDPSRPGTRANDLFVGTLATFTRVGFRVVAPLGASKQIVELAL